MATLKFQRANDQAKLKAIAGWIGYEPRVYSFSLPSGWTCPFALDCLSKADRTTGKITDGKDADFRCFMATMEAMSPQLRAQVWNNFDILRHMDYEEMVGALYEAVPEDMDICRVHVGGDFYNQRYFEAWLQVARLYPQKKFYAYTKSIPYWLANLGDIPPNFILTGSRGGRMDALLDEFQMKVAEVVFSLEEAEERGLPIDHTEFYALNDEGNFALLIHGTQPKGTEAAEATKTLRKQGVQYAYSR